MDRSLGTLLRALQSSSDQQDVSRLLASATNLLIHLSNPSNITLLTSQLLSAPLIWQRPDGLRTTIQVLNIFNSAAIHLVQQQDQSAKSASVPLQGALSQEEWATAVVRGADDRSARWRHLCVLAGLLIGFGGRGEKRMPPSLRLRLENATVKAANMALHENGKASDLPSNSIAILLSHVFDHLSDAEKLDINHDLLLPLLYRAPLFAREGLYSGYFLSTIDADIVQIGGSRFDWSAKSSTYVQCQRMAAGPLIASLGSLSRLTAFSVEHVQKADLLSTMVTELSAFTRSLCVQWRQNKLSEVDITEEVSLLSDEAIRTTLPLLWRVLKSTMFAIVIVLKSVLRRVLGDHRVPAEAAPFIAIQTLQILRNLYFTSSRLGHNAFSQYIFVYLTAIDLLSQYPVQTEAFLRDIRPTSSGSISRHPLDRCLDLYFLNTAEHFTTVLPPELNELSLIAAAMPYLGLASDSRLLEIFEAAHSVMLAVLSTPQNSNLLTKHLRPYLEVLFQVFPQNLSSRQFRMAIKTLIRITSPPSPISLSQPLFPSIILELVRDRIQSASAAPLHETLSQSPANQEKNEEPALSEQSVLVLALIDALAYLPLEELEAWLPLVAGSINNVQEAGQLENCRQRFWQALSTGEMDVERAALCVGWWGTGGGREMLLNGIDRQDDGMLMSGGLQESSRL